MKAVGRLCIAVLLCFLLPWDTTARRKAETLSSQEENLSPLSVRLEHLLSDPLLTTSEVGITVYDLTARQPLFVWRDKKLCRPASVEKLLTAVTALERLGADHAFTTTVYRSGVVEDSVLRGDLYVVGGFDPEFGEREMDSLADSIKALSIRRIEGGLVGDVSLTDSLPYGDGWAWNDVVYEFQPCLSPLMFCKGTVSVTALPVLGDTVARLVASPASTYYMLQNRTRCRRPEAGPFRIDRNWMEQGNTLTASGNVSVRVTHTVSLHGSQQFFLHALAERLQQRGIGIAASGYSFGRLPEEDDSLNRAVRVGAVSHSLKEVLTRALKKSDNLSAEAMLRHLPLADGKSAHISAADGVEVIGDLMRRMGYDPKQYLLVDGSGVSLYDYVTPDLLLAFLKFAYSRPDVYEPLREALPLAGVDGTLAYRMRDKRSYRRVRAKTGTVTGISSLAGYAYPPSGHVLAFVIINQNVLKAREARAFQDRVCTELCR